MGLREYIRETWTLVVGECGDVAAWDYHVAASYLYRRTPEECVAEWRERMIPAGWDHV